MIESLVEQIEARFAEAQAQMCDPEVIGDRQRYADAGRAFNQLAPAAKLAEEWRLARLGRRGRAGAARRGRRGRRDARRARGRARADRAPRGGDPARDGRAGPQRRQERDRRDPRRRGRRRGRHLGRRPLPHVQPLRGAARLQGRDDGAPPTAPTRSRSRATARTRSSSSRAARTACSACPRPSPRGASTRRRRRSRCCPRSRTSRSRSTRTTCRSTSTAPPGRAGSRSTRPTRPCGSRTSRPAIVISMQDEKSQLQNRERAMKLLRAKLYEAKLAEQQAELAADRTSQVGTGDRAEKIRTYNYPAAPRHRPPDQLQRPQPRAGARGRAGRAHLRAAGRREAPPPRGAGGRLSRRRSRRRRSATRSTPRSIPLTAAGCDTPRLDAEVLLAAALGVDRGDADRRLAARARRARRRARSWTPSRRRREREPVAYILGTQGLPAHRPAVDRRVLIPRPETEHVVEAALGAAARRAGGRRRHGLGRDRAGAEGRAAGPRGVRDRRQRGRARRRARERRAARAST